MNNKKKKKQAEAIRRMKEMKIYNDVIQQFQKKGIVCISTPPLGAHFYANEELRKVIAEFEKEYDALVYTGIQTYTDIMGLTYELFYVSDHKEEWEYDDNDRAQNWQVVYVYNKSTPEFSEIGGIGYELTPAGGLRRTA